MSRKTGLLLVVLAIAVSPAAVSPVFAADSAAIKMGAILAVTGPAAFLGLPEAARSRCWSTI